MQYAPNQFKPDAFNISNGSPAHALHILEVDRYNTWLATRKLSRPAMAGVFTDNSSQVWTFSTDIPAFTQHVRFGFFCSGKGTILLKSDADTWDALSGTIPYGTGLSGTHSIADAETYWFDTPVTVSDHTTLRAMDSTFQAQPLETEFSFTITDESGSETLEVYAVYVRPMFPDESAVLP